MTCRFLLHETGLLAPKTCAFCGLGPCQYGKRKPDLSGASVPEPVKPLKPALADGHYPRPYDVDDPKDRARLMRELQGYMRVSLINKEGTDREGRAYAYAALVEINAKEKTS